MARILVVEDDIDICHLVSLLLERTGHDVMMATDGAEGIVLAQAALPDLIVMDLILPRVDGWLAIEHLKGDPRTRHIPILVLSAHAQMDDRMRARSAGCDGFLTKPFDFERLLTQVAALTERDLAVGQ
jgi:two-component system, cell cycle response regulator DivK